MKSSASPLTPSSDLPRRTRRRWLANWPENLLLPILVAVVQTLAVTPLLYMFFGEDFGLTGGRSVMWPGGLGLLGLAAFWTAKFTMRVTTDPRWFPMVMAACWMVSVGVWVGLEPSYGLTGLLAEPGSLVGERGYLIAPLLLSLGIWWQGIRYATVGFLFTAEEIRGSTQRSWLVLVGSLVLAALIDNGAGRDALGTTRFVVPAMMIASVALVAAAEIHASRQQIRQSGGRPPTWSRWGRLVGGLGLAILGIALITMLLLTPGSFSAMIGGIVAMMRGVGQLALWVLYGVFYVLYYVFYALSELFRAIFDVDFGPMEPPERPAAMEGGPLEFQEQEDEEEWKYASLLRWGLLGMVVLCVVVLLFRMTRRAAESEADEVGDEERSSVFSADLAKSQLRNLFRRGGRGSRLRNLDFDVAPGNVRETWRYLQILANRQEVGRREAETPQDFAGRLRATWPGTAASLNDLARRYERSRYGEIDSERDYAAALDDWSDIYRRRREVEER
ncbi:MAG TPA: DUF4129 domain-containing protein [Thermomicrobiales bacterium]|nr:DUF4129 domain-containing protein [Thermomicrobiales bacterium]